MDGEKFYLYKYSGTPKEVGSRLRIKSYRNSLWNPLFSSVCKATKTKEYNDFYTDLRWTVASRFKLRVYYIKYKNVLVHSSFCTPKSFKFPFMKNNDYHIGPCFTDANYRGKGIYPSVLNYIVSDLRKNTECGNIYMIIEENNTSSREGVKKAGFVEVASLYRKGRLKKYYVKEWL